jgi:hypothetical protein
MTPSRSSLCMELKTEGRRSRTHAAPQLLHQGGDSHLLSSFMEAFHHRCIERRLPPLDSLIVHVAGPRMNFPGSGYFRVNNLADRLAPSVRAEQVVQATSVWTAEKDECRSWGARG